MTTESKQASKPTMTAQQICERFDKSPVYVKRALQNGWLKGHKELMEGTKVPQWVSFVEDVEAWRKACEAHKSPKARFTGTPRQVAEVKDYLANAKPEEIKAIRRSLGLDQE